MPKGISRAFERPRQDEKRRLRDASGITRRFDEARRERARTPKAARRVSAMDGANSDRTGRRGPAPSTVDGCSGELQRRPLA